MIQKVIKSMIEYFGNDVNQINHSLKVYGFASTIGSSEINDQHQIDIIEIAAVLHDIGIPEARMKYHSSAGKYQELEGPPIARGILERLNVDSEKIDRICYLIGNHHSYSEIEGIDFQILVEADFLVNIFEEQMSKTMISSIKQKYFQTQAGKTILDLIYSDDQMNS